MGYLWTQDALDCLVISLLFVHRPSLLFPSAPAPPFSLPPVSVRTYCLHGSKSPAQILDPLQLLSQLEQLQKALWRHAILPTVQPQHAPAHATVHFSLERADEASNDPSPEAQVEAKPLPLPKRRHKKYEKSRRPHDWRSRPDPFEGFWEQITAWLIANPERTGVSLFQQLQDLYPGRFRDTQVRTLQRGLQKLRARLLITFDDQGTQEPVNGQPSTPVLRALATVGAL